jgi:hypothetical protein
VGPLHLSFPFPKKAFVGGSPELGFFCDFLYFSDLIYAANVINDYNNKTRTITTRCISKKFNMVSRQAWKRPNHNPIFSIVATAELGFFH